MRLNRKEYYRVDKKVNIACILLSVILLVILSTATRYESKQQAARSAAIYEMSQSNQDNDNVPIPN